MILAKNLTHRLISTNFGMILDIPLNIFSPNDWVIIVRFEELRHIARPCFNSLESLVTEDAGQVSMDGGNSGGGKVVVEDPECRDHL